MTIIRIDAQFEREHGSVLRCLRDVEGVLRTNPPTGLRPEFVSYITAGRQHLEQVVDAYRAISEDLAHAQKRADHQERRANSLADAVTKSNLAVNEAYHEVAKMEESLHRIPSWVRRLFGVQ